MEFIESNTLFGDERGRFAEFCRDERIDPALDSSMNAWRQYESMREDGIDPDAEYEPDED